MKLKALIATALLVAGAAHAGKEAGEHEYLFHECDAKYHAILDATGSQPLAANFNAACGIGLAAGLKGDKEAQREAAEIVAKYAPQAETGMGDAEAIFIVAQYQLFLHEYERGYQVTHGN